METQTSTDATATERALTLDDVCRLTGLSRATVQRMERAGDFPPPRRLGVAAVRWLSSDVETWLRTRAVRTRRGAA